MAFANLGGIVTLKDYNEDNKELINLQKETYLIFCKNCINFNNC